MPQEAGGNAMNNIFLISQGASVRPVKTVSLNCDRTWASILQENHLLGYAEKSLFRAVLKQSLCDLFCCHIPPVPRDEIISALCRQAQDWFFSASEDPFSFLWICRCLGIDSQWLQLRLYKTIWQQSIPLEGLEILSRELGKSHFEMTERRVDKLKAILTREARVSAISVGKQIFQSKERLHPLLADESASIADIAYAV